MTPIPARAEAREKLPGQSPEHGSAAWIEERREYLGASEVAGALGLSPYERPLDVWARKLAVLPPREPTVAMELGNAAEPLILARYAKRTGAVLVSPGSTVHLLEPWLRATPDAIADGRRNVQAKFVVHGHREWGPEEAGAEGVPEWYLVQVQIEMEVLGLAETDIAALLLGEEHPRIYHVLRDADLAESLVEEAREWWERYIVPRDPDTFPADGSTETERERLRARFPKLVRPLQPAPAEVVDLVRRYAATRTAEAALKAEKDRIGNQICAAIGDAEGFEFEGGKATWRPRKKPTAWRAVADALRPPAELVAKHTPPPERVLDVRLKGESDDE